MFDFWKMRKSYTTRLETESLICRTVLNYPFIKLPAISTLTGWTIDAAEANNIASGFDPYFYYALTAGAGAPTLVADGLTLTTGAAGAGNDIILQPHTVVALSLFGTAGVLTSAGGKNIRIAWAIKTGASVTLCMIGAGGMENIGSAVLAGGGDEQSFFTYNSALSPNWRFVIVTNGVAVYYDTLVPVLPDYPYLLEMVLRASDSRVDMYINSAHIGTTVGAVGAAINHYPVCFVETGEAAAKHIHVRGVFVEINHSTS